MNLDQQMEYFNEQIQVEEKKTREKQRQMHMQVYIFVELGFFRHKSK
mgnify:CR=1 FL=1